MVPFLFVIALIRTSKRNKETDEMFIAELKNKMIAIYKSLLEKYKGDAESYRKAVLINVICIIGIFILIPMGCIAFWQSNYQLGYFDFLIALLLIFTLTYLNRTGKTEKAAFMGISCVSLFFWFLVFTGGVNNSAYVWIYTYPLFAMFLLGAKNGVIVNILFFVIIVLFFIIEPQSSFFTAYSIDLKMRIIPSFFVVLAYAFLFELMRERSNNKLQCEVEEHRKTAEELHVAKTTSENVSRAKSDFLAHMSHELRTPLNHIIGFTELILDKHFGNLNKTQEEYLTDVHKSSNYLLSLINDILDISKIEAGKLTLDPSPVNLKALLKNSFTIIKEKVNKKGITISFDIKDLPKTIIADERKLKQIMYNLLSNAVKFTPDQGRIKLKVHRCNIDSGDSFGTENGHRNIYISVEDTGIGLKAADIERIFNPFEQINTARSKGNQGTGLGLALTKNLVELHGGKIWVESDGVNKGSNFRLIIPVNPNLPVVRM
jgi:signal transduction histidine kinase